MKFLILLTGIIDEAGMALLKEIGECRIAKSLAEEDLAREIADADALIVRPPAVITRRIIENGKRLKVIGRHGVGYDNIDINAATQKKIPVTYTPGANAISVAEHAISFMCALSKNMAKMDRAVRAGDWMARDRYEGLELEGKTCSLLGLGRVGLEVSQRLKAFSMRILYYDVIRKEQAERELSIEWVPFSQEDRSKGIRVPEKLLNEADFLSIHIPLTDETKGIIGERELRRIKSGAYVINTARGGLIDEKALFDAIRSCRLAGAALDVFEEEPLSSQNPLLQLEDVIVSPHSAALTRESKRRMARTVAEDVISTLEKKRAANVVNPEAFE